jgi:regulatory protein
VTPGGGSAEPPADSGPGAERAECAAFELAVGALARKERTTVELTQWLRARGVAPAHVEAAVGRLIEVGELDDARFAQRYAEDKRELRGWGPERIRDALHERGVAPELVESAVGESAEAVVERARASLARRGEPAGDDVQRGRALAFLTRRGYDYEVAYEAVRRAGREAA